MEVIATIYFILKLLSHYFLFVYILAKNTNPSFLLNEHPFIPTILTYPLIIIHLSSDSSGIQSPSSKFMSYLVETSEEIN